MRVKCEFSHVFAPSSENNVKPLSETGRCRIFTKIPRHYSSSQRQDVAYVRKHDAIFRIIADLWLIDRSKLFAPKGDLLSLRLVKSLAIPRSIIESTGSRLSDRFYVLGARHFVHSEYTKCRARVRLVIKAARESTTDCLAGLDETLRDFAERIPSIILRIVKRKYWYRPVNGLSIHTFSSSKVQKIKRFPFFFN